ncbi:hypothetical protein [uncultured Methanospirillum sp.]|uniref:hypothetical protein n=1 Tax=uncultured Methanospirillum sp. TaxID=262503 RepID=UPI0029C72C4D|nr:hypothetical protein [uncultured Methanospirillum sp.]
MTDNSQRTVTETDPVVTGWCPNHGIAVKKKEGPFCMGLISQIRGSGPRDGIPDIETYSHRQIGIVQIWASVGVLAVLLITSVLVPEIWFLFLVAILALGLGLLFFSTLTVQVTESAVCIRFGPVPVIRKRIPLEKIHEWSRVTTPWYYGWGLRYIKNGTLYNISGFDGVEIRFQEGKRIRIGTDDPAGLTEAIRKATDLPPSSS